MQDRLIEKLRSHLDGTDTFSERDVVYFLVETRKMFERDGAFGSAFPTLQFYCNFALHSKLTKNQAQKFLAKVSPLLCLRGSSPPELHMELNELLTLGAFRVEIRSLLQSLGISSDITDVETRWGSFLESYANVVEDCDLILVSDEVSDALTGDLRVASLTIHSNRKSVYNYQDPFPMDWLVTYTDGRRGQLQLTKHGLLGATLTLM